MIDMEGGLIRTARRSRQGRDFIWEFPSFVVPLFAGRSIKSCLFQNFLKRYTLYKKYTLYLFFFLFPILFFAIWILTFDIKLSAFSPLLTVFCPLSSSLFSLLSFWILKFPISPSPFPLKRSAPKACHVKCETYLTGAQRSSISHRLRSFRYVLCAMRYALCALRFGFDYSTI